MGMMYLAAVAAAKKKQDQRRAAARRRHRREEEDRRKAQEEKDRRYSSYKDSSYTYLDCAVYEIEHDEDLKAFFKKLESKIHEIRSEEGKDVRARAEELDALIQRYDEERKKIADKIRESGIELGEENTERYYMGDFDSAKLTRKRRGSINTPDVSDRQYSTYYTFNGVRLTESMLKDDNVDAINFAYEGTVSSLEHDKSSRSEKMEQIEKLRKRKLMNKEKKQARIAELEKEIMKLDYAIERGEYKKKELEVIMALTPEQKQNIIKYLEATSEMFRARNTIYSLVNEFERKLTPMDNKELLERAMQKLEEEGMTEEEIFAIFEKMDRIAIRRSRGEYSSLRHISSHEAKILRNFITNVYEEDPTFVERNMEEAVPDIDDDDNIDIDD